MKPLFIDQFYHEGRGPELQRIHYNPSGTAIAAADYYLPDHAYTPENLLHVRFVNAQVFMVTPEEVEGYGQSQFNPWEGEQRFALVDFGKSSWLLQFSQHHLANCSHYRCMFYDEFLDVICEEVEIGHGGYSASGTR